MKLNIILSPFGQMFVFDGENQVPELQKSPLTLWAEHAERLGYNLDGQQIENCGRKITLHKADSGWNWSIE